ncbi:MAG: LysR family transcriptional regulator [Rhodobacteraceae bacterium]|nr:LysR family transcriptional regulator [Paracoccaceae bacterium]
MNWDDLRHFAGFAKAGSLSGAARDMHVEHATIARRIASLEATLRMKLVDRRGRRLVLTSDGVQIAAIASRIEADTEHVLRLAKGTSSKVMGDVTISAPPSLAATMLAAPLTRLRKQHPDLNVHVSSESETVSLDRREADIAIRLKRPENGDLTAMKLGEIPFRLYGQASYLKRTAQADWTYIHLHGALSDSPQQIDVKARNQGRSIGVSTDQIEMQRAFVLSGAGVAMLPDFLAVLAPSLAKAEPQEQSLLREVWLVIHTDMKSAAPVQAVIGALRTMRF